MIVLDANILIRAVLGRRVRQLIETYGSRGAHFFGRVARTWKIESCRRKNGREYRTLIFFAEVKKRGGCPRLGLGARVLGLPVAFGIPPEPATWAKSPASTPSKNSAPTTCSPAVQGMRNADQRSYRQIQWFILHRRDLWRAHFRLRRQFCLAEFLLGPQLRDLHPQLQILQLALDQPSQLLIRHLFLIETLPWCRHFFLPSIRASAMPISPSANCALRFTIPCRSTNTLLASPK